MLKPTYHALASVNKNYVMGHNLWHGGGQTFIGVTMPDNKTEWYRTDGNSPRFVHDVAELLMKTHGDKSHLYALERVVKEGSSEEEVKLWREVLTLLDKELAK
jgi:hypothetical protein